MSDQVFVCEGCNRDTRSKTRLCRRCRGQSEGDRYEASILRRKKRRDRDDDAGRDADEGWAYSDDELDS